VTDFYTTLRTRFPSLTDKNLLLADEPLSGHCSFRIGGPADAFAIPETQADLIDLLSFVTDHYIPYMILGRGSNLLIGDRGIRGLVISTRNLNKLSLDENYISAYCGVSLKDLCQFALNAGLSGLEFASGIPGSVGGAVYMNAGAYGGEIKDVLYCSKCLNAAPESLAAGRPMIHLKAENHLFSYRHSVFQEGKLIHLSSVFRLEYADQALIKTRMDELNLQRNQKQPMDLPSGGSVFKRPEGYFTGKLIDDCGLRGYRIGGAAISDLHCGFIVNLGGATAQDVLLLIRYVQISVKDRFGVDLEPELRMVGEF